MRRLAVTLALCSLLVSGSALAGTPNPVNKARLDKSIRYLQEAQNLDGGFGGDFGQASSQGISAWVALALAAGGINPRCQARSDGADAYSFLAGHFHEGLEEEISYPNIATTAFERELMVVNASGTDPHGFAGYDLVEEVLARALPNGSFFHVPGGGGAINDTVFAIVSLAPVKEPEAQLAVQRAADWLVIQQDDDGGWAWAAKGAPTEADMTGAAIQALRAAGRANTEAEQKGLRYLSDMQNADGGFPEFVGDPESNVASTAWAVQGVWAAGQDPESWVKGGKEPLSYMASLQQADGRIRWKASQDMNGVWMTAYVVPAFAGQTWPIPAPPCSRALTSTSQQPGQGEGTQSGSGTIAGGGGRGAPLFSRPKPQSKGKTPGGARVLHRESNPVNHSETRRGSNTVQPGGTEMHEANREQDQVDKAGGSTGDGGGTSPRHSGRQGEEGDGREVTGTLVSAKDGTPAFGAPGLHSAGADPAGTPWLAIAIGAVALLLGLAGSQLERRRGGAFA